MEPDAELHAKRERDVNSQENGDGGSFSKKQRLDEPMTDEAEPDTAAPTSTSPPLTTKNVSTNEPTSNITLQESDATTTADDNSITHPSLDEDEQTPMDATEDATPTAASTDITTAIPSTETNASTASKTKNSNHASSSSSSSSSSSASTASSPLLSASTSSPSVLPKAISSTASSSTSDAISSLSVLPPAVSLPRSARSPPISPMSPSSLTMPLSPVQLESTHPPLLSASSHQARIQSSSVLTSDELNFLVYRYLLESGFVHSAFVFATEGYIGKSGLEGTAQVPPGALVQFVQKGLQYLEIESHINDDGTETQCEESFSVITPHVCQTNGRKRIFDPYEPISADYGVLEIDFDETAVLRGHEELATACLWNPSSDVIASVSSDGTCCIWDLTELSLDDKSQSRDRDGSVIVNAEYVLKTSRAEPVKEDGTVAVTKETAAAGSSDEETEDEDVTTKKKSGSKEAASSKKDKKEAKDAKNGAVPKPEPDVGKSVLTLDWSEDGGLVCVGCYDGSVHVWSSEGKAVGSKTEHAAPVSVVKWARKGLIFLSGSMDHVVLLWTEACVVTARYTTHQGPVLDVDWRDGRQFATASMDKKICVFETGKTSPVKEVDGHRGDVNVVSWSPEGDYLASCSVDCAVKVWRVSSSLSKPQHDFREHTREVCCLAWCPVSTEANGHTTPHLLASGSIDTTVKLWDLERGECVLTLSKHVHPVTVLRFSQDGRFLATGSHDRLHVWAVKDGELIRTFKNANGVNDLSWNKGGQLAACYSDGSVYVVDTITGQ